MLDFDANILSIYEIRLILMYFNYLYTLKRGITLYIFIEVWYYCI